VVSSTDPAPVAPHTPSTAGALRNTTLLSVKFT
jgi:hypothetical protein